MQDFIHLIIVFYIVYFFTGSQTWDHNTFTCFTIYTLTLLLYYLGPYFLPEYTVVWFQQFESQGNDLCLLLFWLGSLAAFMSYAQEIKEDALRYNKKYREQQALHCINRVLRFEYQPHVIQCETCGKYYRSSSLGKTQIEQIKQIEKSPILKCRLCKK